MSHSKIATVEWKEDALVVQISMQPGTDWFVRSLGLFMFAYVVVPIVWGVLVGKGLPSGSCWVFLVIISIFILIATFGRNVPVYVWVSVSKDSIEWRESDANHVVYSGANIPMSEVVEICMSTDNSSLASVKKRDGTVEGGWLFIDQYQDEMIIAMRTFAPHVRCRF